MVVCNRGKTVEYEIKTIIHKNNMLYLMTDNVFGEPYLLMHSKNLKGNINKAEWVGSSSEKQ